MRKNIPYNVTTEDGSERVVYDGRYACVTGIIIAIEKNTSYILANKRGPGCPNFQGYWNLPCGYMDAGSAEENVSREIYEETGVKISPDRLSFVGISDTGKERNVTLRYVAILPEGRQELKTVEEISKLGGESNEVTDVKWIDFRFVDKYKWAFNHDDLIHQVIADMITYYKMYVEK